MTIPLFFGILLISLGRLASYNEPVIVGHQYPPRFTIITGIALLGMAWVMA